MYVVRTKIGLLKLYEDKPKRNGEQEWEDKNFLCTLNSSLFPELTWKSDPLEIELVPKEFLEDWKEKHRHILSR